MQCLKKTVVFLDIENWANVNIKNNIYKLFFTKFAKKAPIL